LPFCPFVLIFTNLRLGKTRSAKAKANATVKIRTKVVMVMMAKGNRATGQEARPVYHKQGLLYY